MTHDTTGLDGAADPVTPKRLMQYAFGYSAPLMIHAAVATGVFDVLDGGAKTPAELSATTGASARGIRILLNGLTAIAAVNRDADGRYSLAPDTSAFLVSGKPGYHGELFRHFATQLIPNWLELEEIVRTGKPAAQVNSELGGAEFFEQFVESLFPISYLAARRLACELGLERSTSAVRVLDIAAGSGVWGITLAQTSDQVHVSAVDWANVLTVTKRVAARMGVADRLDTIPGDIHDAEFGGPYQVATLGHILHSEGVQRSRDLLKKVNAALAPGGTIAIAEFVVDDDRTGPPMSLIFSVNMLVNTDEGDTYTFSEIRGWLEKAGFVNVRQLDSPGPSPLILATKPVS